MVDYLVTKLWLELNAKTELINKPQDSASNKGVQLSDMFSGLMQQSFEDSNIALFKLLPYDRILVRTLFFKNNLLQLIHKNKGDVEIEVLATT